MAILWPSCHKSLIWSQFLSFLPLFSFRPFFAFHFSSNVFTKTKLQPLNCCL
uniref:Uncharacterized protein n=1 Tax=Populus trichocarpa TaxID=3694 RepID=B9PAH3_POPTR